MNHLKFWLKAIALSKEFSVMSFSCPRKYRSSGQVTQDLVGRICCDWRYRKNSKIWDTSNNYHNCPTNGTVGFYSAVLRSKDADRITNREDSDQTAPCGAV